MLYRHAHEALGSERDKNICNLLLRWLDTTQYSETTEIKSKQLRDRCSRIKRWKLRDVNLAQEPGALTELSQKLIDGRALSAENEHRARFIVQHTVKRRWCAC
jgi:hypothetical protein